MRGHFGETVRSLVGNGAPVVAQTHSRLDPGRCRETGGPNDGAPRGRDVARLISELDNEFA